MVGAAVGILSVFKPWLYTPEGYKLGIQEGTGIFTAFLFAAAIALVTIGAGPKPLEFRLLLAVVPATFLTWLVSLIWLTKVPADSGTGFGAFLTMFFGLATASVAFFTREKAAKEDEAAPADKPEAPAQAAASPPEEKPAPAKASEDKPEKGEWSGAV